MERVEIVRDCEAVQIPAGTPITLEKGIEVFITQSLGGTFTLQVPAYGISSKPASTRRYQLILSILGWFTAWN
jgi:hypothetical protein